MGKWKSILIIAIALLVIVAGAHFPQIAAAFLDLIQGTHAQYTPVTPVKLEFRQNSPILSKLFIFSQWDSNIAIKESKARMSQDEVMEAVYLELEPYIDAQLMAFSEKSVQAQPHLFQVQSGHSLQCIVWIVTITGPDDNYSFLDIAVDDDSGKILRISYGSEFHQNAPVGQEALHVLTDIYFSGLGIHDYQNSIADNLDYAGDNADAVRYVLVDTEWGPITIDFNVYDTGFYIAFPRE